MRLPFNIKHYRKRLYPRGIIALTHFSRLVLLPHRKTIQQTDAGSMIPKYDMPSGFEQADDGGASLIVRPKAREAVCDFLAHAGGTATAYAGRGRLYRIDRGDGKPAILVKQYMRGGLFRGILKDRFLTKMRFIAELYLTGIAAKQKVRTSRIVGLAFRPCALIFKRVYLFTEELADTSDLAGWCSAHADALPAKRRALARVVAREVRSMHDSGIWHADLHLKNILAGKGGTPAIYIIDFDRGDYFKKMSDERRMENLMRLDRSAEKFNRGSVKITLTDRLRFLKAYCGGRGEMLDRYKDLVRAQMKWRKLHRLWWRIIGRA
jgi:hypothetical protein